jgi:hypothetical protein
MQKQNALIKVNNEVLKKAIDRDSPSPRYRSTLLKMKMDQKIIEGG